MRRSNSASCSLGPHRLGQDVPHPPDRRIPGHYPGRSSRPPRRFEWLCGNAHQLRSARCTRSTNRDRRATERGVITSSTEVDKIAAHGRTSGPRRTSGEGVQRALLSVLDGRGGHGCRAAARRTS
ncbi:MAG: AAA family ATPase [bacterium]|nr:AAA family ATPase [bacterium]